MVLNKHHGNIPANAVYIGRGSKWGNPFVIGEDGTRAEVVMKYRQLLWAGIENGSVTREELAELHNKDLVCFCAPKPCHGHVLESAANWAYHELHIPRKTMSEIMDIMG